MSASRSQSDQKLVALVERIKDSVPADTSIAELAESTELERGAPGFIRGEG